jgi:predicted alpha/beta-fold hydrolase
MDEYVAPWWLRNGHVMTVFAAMRRRRFPSLPEAEKRCFDVAPGTRVLAKCHWQADRRAHPTLVLLHGLEGSANAPYMQGLAERGIRAGFNVVRLNQRNCGRTEHLSTTLYHSGLSEDPAAVIEELIRDDGLPSIGVIGYSLGGNVALRLAGVYGDAAPSRLHAVCAVSPPVDLACAADEIERLPNRYYQWNFLKDLKARMRRKAAFFPDRYSIDHLEHIRTIREFDDRYTAPHFGFRDASDYYHRASALRVADRIRVPTLIISADDDPFIPVAPLRDPAVAANPCISVVVTRWGGHCGFIERRGRGSDGDEYWAERQAVAFAETHTWQDGGSDLA